MTKKIRGEVNTRPIASTEESIAFQTQQVLDRITEALSNGNGYEIIRIVSEATTHGFIPSDENLATWLDRSLGHDFTERFINTFVNLTCFYCTKGVIPCEECKGQGHGKDHKLCPTCLALGINRCDFCGGSGWFTINHIPRGFQLPVITRRITSAIKEAEIVLVHVVPNLSELGPAQAMKLAAKALIQANRLLCVFENMMVAAKQEESRNAEAINGAGSVFASWKQVAPRLSDRICTLLSCIADAESAEALSASPRTTLRMAQKKSEFYADLALSQNFEGTLLWHPLLVAEFQASSSETNIDSKDSASSERVNDRLQGNP